MSAFKIGQTIELSEINQFFQGDVFVTPVDCLPEGAIELKAEQGGFHIFAHGETTGHIHAIKEQQNVKCYEANDNKSITGKSKFIVIEAGDQPLFFHGKPGHDQGDHAFFKMPPVKEIGKKVVFLFRRQFGKDITDPSKFTQIAD